MKDIIHLLQEGKIVRLHPIGTSMYPLFTGEKDEAEIAPLGEHRIQKGDVVLYRRESGRLVLHRVSRAGSDGFYMAGDNQTALEGPVKVEQIKGILVAFIRKGRYVRTTDPIYIFWSRLWLFLRPLRRLIYLYQTKTQT